MAPAPAERGDPALANRLATGALLTSVAIGAVLAGGWWLVALLLAGLALAAREWARLAPAAGPFARLLLAGAPLAVGGVAVVAIAAGAGAVALPVLLLGTPLAGALAALVPDASPHRVALGVLYLAVPCAVLVWLREDPRFGTGVVLWLMAVVATTDTAAYAAGRTIGGARLAPSISPGKTWAGLAGGVLGAALVGAAGGIALGWPVLPAGLLAAGLALVAQAGDLLESWLKRAAGMKDSGTLLPGHGGILDRIDGLLAATVALGLLLAVLA